MDCSLGGRVGRVVAHAKLTACGGEEYHFPTAPLLDHNAPGLLACQPGPFDVDIHPLFPLLKRKLCDGLNMVGSSRRDQDINAAKLFDRGLHHTAHIVGAARVPGSISDSSTCLCNL